MAEANVLLILILAIIIVFFPSIWAKIVSAIVLLIQLFKNAEDLKVSLTDKRGTVVLTSEDIAKDVKRYSKVTRFAKFGKLLNKIIP